MHTSNRIVAPFVPELEQQRYHYLLNLVKASPNQGELWEKFANSCRGLGYLSEAIDAYQKAIECGYQQAECARVKDTLCQRFKPLELDDPFQPTPFLLYDDFLSSDEVDQVWGIYHQNLNRLNDSYIADAVIDKGVRSSKVSKLRDAPEIDFFKHKARPILESAYDYFRIPIAEKPSLAIELTSHTNDGFYDIHNDVNVMTPVRRLSYIYYFHQQPRAFEGGQLHLFDTDVENDTFVNKLTAIEPLHNRLVIFPSAYQHRVFKVSLPGDVAIQGRHTINGWHSDLSLAK